MKTFKAFVRTLPHLLLALAIAVAVWIIAVTAADPMEQHNLPGPVNLQPIGLSTDLVIISNLPATVTVKVSAPNSIWAKIYNRTSPTVANIDLSGLDAGTHNVPVQVSIPEKPTRILSIDPDTIEVILEERTSKTVPVNVSTTGEPALGFKAEVTQTDINTAAVSGPSTLIDSVVAVQATVDITNARENFIDTEDLQAVDANGGVVSGVSITPASVTVNQTVTALGGYRNVVVKVVWLGQVARGYRLTNISVDPPAVTLYSANPQLVENLAGMVETFPLDLSGASSDFVTQLALNLQPGITAVDQSLVTVRVSISAIESSLTLTNIPVEIVGLGADLQAQISPGNVDVILNGPLPTLEKLTQADVHVTVDLSNLGPGSYKKEPQVTFSVEDVQKSSVVPNTLDVTITQTTTP
jgi:YbbR domain-containing protein